VKSSSAVRSWYDTPTWHAGSYPVFLAFRLHRPVAPWLKRYERTEVWDTSGMTGSARGKPRPSQAGSERVLCHAAACRKIYGRACRKYDLWRGRETWAVVGCGSHRARLPERENCAARIKPLFPCAASLKQEPARPAAGSHLVPESSPFQGGEPASPVTPGRHCDMSASLTYVFFRAHLWTRSHYRQRQTVVWCSPCAPQYR
jgi:hypothetical protein